MNDPDREPAWHEDELTQYEGELSQEIVLQELIREMRLRHTRATVDAATDAVLRRLLLRSDA